MNCLHRCELRVTLFELHATLLFSSYPSNESTILRHFCISMLKNTRFKLGSAAIFSSTMMIRHTVCVSVCCLTAHVRSCSGGPWAPSSGKTAARMLKFAQLRPKHVWTQSQHAWITRAAEVFGTGQMLPAECALYTQSAKEDVLCGSLWSPNKKVCCLATGCPGCQLPRGRSRCQETLDLRSVGRFRSDSALTSVSQDCDRSWS